MSLFGLIGLIIILIGLAAIVTSLLGGISIWGVVAGIIIVLVGAWVRGHGDNIQL